MIRIVFAEDDPDIQALVMFKLERSGFAVTPVRDGVEALDLIRRERPDLAILDVQMPVVSGMEVCRRLRADRETARIPVLLLTAFARPEDADQGYAAGADDYLVKPFSPRELLDRIGALLSRVGT
jgi:two-component system, OmpR family, phosphate regulon response regulator PhoB